MARNGVDTIYITKKRQARVKRTSRSRKGSLLCSRCYGRHATKKRCVTTLTNGCVEDYRKECPRKDIKNPANLPPRLVSVPGLPYLKQRSTRFSYVAFVARAFIVVAILPALCMLMLSTWLVCVSRPNHCTCCVYPHT